MNRTLRSKLMLTATLVMFALTAVMMTRNEALLFRDEGRLIVKVDPADSDTIIFYWRSEVDVPMARRFAEGFDEWRGEASRIVIDLHSPGGAVHEGEAVIQVINQMKKTHIVETRVRGRRACYSMCVPIFLQGEVRQAAPSARFMFHEPSARDFYTGEETPEPAFEKRYTTARFVERYFVNSPMAPDWRDELTANWRGKDVWWTGRELVDEGSGIVTVLE